MKYFVFFLILIGFTVAIPYAYADCNINTDWPDAPCLDVIVNGAYLQYEVDRWSEYYSYKGSVFMEEKHLEMNKAINENRLQGWVDESMTHRNVYEYYFFSGRAPDTGEHSGQFDVITTNEENAPEYGEFSFPEITPLLIVGIIGGIIIGFVFMIRRKRK